MLRVSFVIATLNELRRLPSALESICRQRYPKDLIDVIVVDAGSVDGTVEYAIANGCKVIENPMLRCEPGIARGYAVATGDVVVMFAADNAVDPDFVSQIVQPFADPAVFIAVPRLVSTTSDCLTTRYLNDFTDPFNHFLYGRAASPITFKLKYRTKRITSNYVVFDFPIAEPPLVGLAQGVAIRSGVAREHGTEEDDIMPISAMLADGHDLAYVPGALVEHHTVASLADFLAKFGPRITKRLKEQDQPIWQRSVSWSSARRLRAYLWPFYSISVILPLFAAVYGFARDARSTWLYHPVITTALGIQFWHRFFKWKMKLDGSN